LNIITVAFDCSGSIGVVVDEGGTGGKVVSDCCTGKGIVSDIDSDATVDIGVEIVSTLTDTGIAIFFDVLDIFWK